MKKPLKIALGVVAVALLMGGWFVWQTLLIDLPHPDELYHYTSAPSTNIYDRHGTLLYQITDPHQGYHSPLTLADIPQHCQNATIATEDATFYQNPGFDTRAMLRALFSNLREGEVVSGASTITQQLARNLMFTEAERTEISYTRKLREVILAWRLTRTYDKSEILTLYLNETYYGNLAYGLEAAAATYFGKEAASLDLAECALLAGLPQSPVYYNPLENLSVAKSRQADVLRLMLQNEHISKEEARLAEQEKLQFAAIPFPIKAPHFVMHVRGDLERRFGLEAIYTQGLNVYTTLDLDIHETAQRIARRHVETLNKREDHRPPRNVRNAAVVVLTPAGEVLAMVGSPDYFDPRIDGNVNATVALRQPGSSIKPLTYAAALDPQKASQYGYPVLTPASMMMDVRTAFLTKEGRPYVPLNYDRTWHGPVLLREALAASLNLVAVKVLEHVGLTAFTETARDFGLTTFGDEDRFGLALTLGGGEVRLLELTGAYAAFPNQGRKVEPYTIERVTNAENETLYQRAKINGPQVLDPRAAYLITDILSDNRARAGAFGEGSPLLLDRPAAAKTGTTTDFRDNWTLGYTPDYITGVWVGNADNEAMRHVSGITGAAPIWREVMLALHQYQPAKSFAPAELTTQTVCAINGLLPSEGCQRTLEEVFIPGTEVRQVDTWHKRLSIDRRTGLLATAECDPQAVMDRWFVIYPVEAETWVQANPSRQAPQMPSPRCAADGLTAQTQADEGTFAEAATSVMSTAPALQFVSPDQGATFRLDGSIPAEVQKLRVAVQVNPALVNPQSVQLLVNGQVLDNQPETLWQMEPGRYQFQAQGLSPQGERVEAVVEVEVRAN